MTRFYNLIAGYLDYPKAYKGITLAILLSIAITNSYSQCSLQHMVCDDYVRVSLDENCQVTLTPEMILETPFVDPNEFIITVWDGRHAIGNTITEEYVNQTLEMSVRCKASGYSCWGYIIIEDKLPPAVKIYPEEVILSCNTDLSSLEITDSTGNRFALLDSFQIDNAGCDSIGSIQFVQDETTHYSTCGQDGIVTRIRRTYIATDKAGNEGRAIQNIIIRKAELADITYPKDTVVSCLDLPADGFDPNLFGRPAAASCDIFKSTYTDTRFPLCGASYKILRTWHVVDWCNNRDTSVTQILETLDTIPPQWVKELNFTPGNTYNVQGSCTGSVRIPKEEYAVARDDCFTKSVEYIVRFQLGDTTLPTGFETIVRDDVEIDYAGDSSVVIHDLPLGTHLVHVIARDACGNTSSAVAPLSIVDDTPPNSICERRTTVVLDHSGVAQLKAISLDDHSFDNCGISHFEVRRLNTHCTNYASDTLFNSSVYFCCNDLLRNPIKVVFRAYDFGGRYSDCIVDIEVQDKRQVTFTCPADVTVNCDFDQNTLISQLGTPSTVSDHCNLSSPHLTIPEYTLNECGLGSFEVTWSVSDNSGIRAQCTQKVTVQNNTLPVVTLPANITIQGCKIGQAHPSIINSEPIFNVQDCERLASSYVDNVDTIPNIGCIRITRNWTVIDWCTYNSLNPSSAVKIGTQLITIIDNDKPSIVECPQDLIFVDSDENCSEQVTITAKGTDNCTSNDDLNYSYSLVINNGQQPETVNGNTKSFTRNLPVGIHHITWTVTDECGNVSDACSYSITISNPFDPVYTANRTIALDINANGFTNFINVSDLENNVTEDCFSELNLSFSNTQQLDQVRYSCADIPNGVNESLIQKLYVTNTTGIQREFNLTIQLTDSGDRCNDLSMDNSNISGVVADESGNVIVNATVSLLNSNGQSIATTTTNSIGYYEFNQLTTGDTYKVKVDLGGHENVGISSLDVVMIQKHVLGLDVFTSPYKLLAADVNHSESISVIDMVRLINIILGKDTTTMKADNAWLFVPKSYKFPDGQVYNYPTSESVDNIKEGVTKVDFVGVKMGDVSGNAIPIINASTSVRSTTNVEYTKEKIGNNLYKLVFTSSKISDWTALQLKIEVDGGRIKQVVGGSLLNDEMNYHHDFQQLTAVCTKPSYSSLSTENLFTLIVSGDENLTIKRNDDFDSKWYNSNDRSSSLNFIEKYNENEFTAISESSVSPNPFYHQTTIGFESNSNEKTTLKIYNLAGQEILATQINTKIGRNEITITKDQLQQRGVYIYVLRTGHSTIRNKMILLQ